MTTTADKYDAAVIEVQKRSEAARILANTVEPGQHIPTVDMDDLFRLQFLRALNKRGLWLNFETHTVWVQDPRSTWRPPVATYGRRGSYQVS